MHTLVYGSISVDKLCPKRIESILETSRKNNESLGVTGLLVCKGQEFLQVLEGRKEELDSLFYKTIATDARHRRIKVLYEGEIADRAFENWSMGFIDLDRERNAAFKLVLEDSGSVLSQGRSVAKHLVKSFCDL